MCIADEVEAIPRARLMLRYCSYSGHIPVEGQHSGTCCEVACIERIICYVQACGGSRPQSGRRLSTEAIDLSRIA